MVMFFLKINLQTPIISEKGATQKEIISCTGVLHPAEIASSVQYCIVKKFHKITLKVP